MLSGGVGIAIMIGKVVAAYSVSLMIVSGMQFAHEYKPSKKGSATKNVRKSEFNDKLQELGKLQQSE